MPKRSGYAYVGGPKKVARYSRKPYTYDRPKATAAARSFTSSMPRKLSTGLPKGLAAAVRKVIQNSKEKKLDVILPTGSLQPTVLISQNSITGPNFYLVVPGPTQGSAQNDRIGNEIGITQANLNVMIQNGSPASAQASQPSIVTMMIGRLKAGITIPNDADWANMFISEAGVPQTAPTTQLASLTYPVNDDYFDIKLRKQFKVGNTVITGLTNSIHSNDFNTYYQESVNVARFMKKTLQFNEDASEPQNEGLYVWFLVHPINGIELTDAGRPTVTMTLTTRYTDA